MNIIFQVKGGLGKVIASTAVLGGFKKRYPSSKIIVVSAYSDVFYNNPHVYKTYNFSQIKGIYSKYIHNQEHKIFIQDPYEHSSHFEQENHIIKTWFELYNLEYSRNIPEIYLSNSELEFYEASFNSSTLPILALHSNGGSPEQNSQYSWPRDIPYDNVLDIIDEFKSTHTIVHIKNPNQATYPNTIPMTDSFRSVAGLLLMADKRLLIDSFAQHLCAALSIPATVCWGITKPEVFGYEIHDNILSNPFTKPPDYQDSVYNNFDFYEKMHKAPYNSLKDVFDSKKIINSLNK